MPGTGNEPEQLRNGVEEVEHLWDEEQQYGFAEVTEDADDRERHAGQVVERIAHKHLGRISGRGGKQEKKRKIWNRARQRILAPIQAQRPHSGDSWLAEKDSKPCCQSGVTKNR